MKNEASIGGVLVNNINVTISRLHAQVICRGIMRIL